MGAIKMTTVEVQAAVTISGNLEEATSSARLWSSGFISAGHWIVNPEDWCESVNRTPLCISVIVLHTLFPSNFCITFCMLEVLCPDLFDGQQCQEDKMPSMHRSIKGHWEHDA